MIYYQTEEAFWSTTGRLLHVCLRLSYYDIINNFPLFDYEGYKDEEESSPYAWLPFTGKHLTVIISSSLLV